MNDKKQLSGRAAIVTGSTSGIGLTIATALASSDANVVLKGFADPNEIEKLRNSLGAGSGVGVIYVPADIARPHDIRDMKTASELAQTSPPSPAPEL